MKVKVTKWNKKDGDTYAANGLIRVNTNKPEYGSLMVMATTIVVTNGFVNSNNKVAFLNGEVTQLETMINEYNLKDGVDFGLAVGPHRIVTLERVESDLGEELGYSPKINPTTGEILTKDGETIYRKTELVAEGSDVIETLISHDREGDTVVDSAKAEFENANEDGK